MKVSSRKLKSHHCYSDSEMNKRNRSSINTTSSESETTKHNFSSKISSFSKKKLFSSDFSLKTALNQLLSEEVYEDLIWVILIIVSLPVILTKRVLNSLQWVYKKLDAFLCSFITNMSASIQEKKKNRFEKKRFSKDMKLELMMKKRQIEQKAKICEKTKMDLVLDLDETLIHCTDQKPSYKTIEFEIPQSEKEGGKTKNHKFYLSKRPFIEDFLEEVSMFFNVHIYTASEQNYADIILSYIDPKHKIQKKLYRNDCIKESDGYTKDLTKINPDLSKVIMLDNSEEAVKYFLENSFIIKSWHGYDRNDTELGHFTKIFIELACMCSEEDIRVKMKKIRRDLKYKYYS